MVCVNVIENDTLISAVAGKSLKTNDSFNWDGKCLIYLFLCDQCNK